MSLGWIDFSKNERNKILSVLNLLTEGSTLDELGIAPIRDGFANMFFPGTSTLQTQAKYFLLVPYACKDMEHSRQTDPNKLLEDLDNLERRFTEKLLNQEDTDGVIGKRSLASKQCIGLIRSILRHMTRFQSICRASWHASF